MAGKRSKSIRLDNICHFKPKFKGLILFQNSSVYFRNFHETDDLENLNHTSTIDFTQKSHFARRPIPHRGRILLRRPTSTRRPIYPQTTHFTSTAYTHFKINIVVSTLTQPHPSPRKSIK